MASKTSYRQSELFLRGGFQYRSWPFRLLGVSLASGTGAGLLRSFLRALSGVVRFGTAVDRALTRRRRLPKPVISVGNLTVGGSGKTPLVIFLGKELLRRSFRVAVLTRGYRGRSTQVDEAALLRRELPGGRVLVSPKRWKAAARSLRAPDPPDVFLLDDGFQHWHLHRDVDIVLLDALMPFGLGGVFPAGLLREPVSALRRSDVVVVSRSDLVLPWTRIFLKDYLRAHFPGLCVVEAREEVVAWRELATGRTAEPPDRVFIACGVGNPVSVWRVVAREGPACVGRWAFADHHRWSPQDVRAVEEAARSCGAHAVVTTAKDATKLAPHWASLRWLVLEIRTVLGEGACRLWDRIERVLGRR